jgi:hypothetical protein
VYVAYVMALKRIRIMLYNLVVVIIHTATNLAQKDDAIIKLVAVHVWYKGFSILDLIDI